MVKSELIQRSPIRIFEKSIHGGLGAGNIGMLVSPKGVGKTACLVHIATDKLIQDRHVLHVSFASRVDHIINWYEDIFKEISKKRELESAVEVHDDIVQNRVIMNFNQRDIETDQMLERIQTMIDDGHFAADTVIFDGYDLTHAGATDIEKIRDFADASGLEIWFSVSVPEGHEVADFIAEYLVMATVVITLEFSGDHVHFRALKDHDIDEPREMHLMLDPRTLLIAEE